MGKKIKNEEKENNTKKATCQKYSSTRPGGGAMHFI